MRQGYPEGSIDRLRRRVTILFRQAQMTECLGNAPLQKATIATKTPVAVTVTVLFSPSDKPGIACCSTWKSALGNNTKSITVIIALVTPLAKLNLALLICQQPPSILQIRVSVACSRPRPSRLVTGELPKVTVLNFISP